MGNGEFVVRRAELKAYNPASPRNCFECDLENSSGKKISFRLTVEGCVGSKGYAAQYDLLEPHFKVGNLIRCGIVYTIRNGCFTMAMYSFMVLRATNQSTGETISSDSYINPSRGFWTVAVPTSEQVLLPGIIEFHGECHIPLLEEGSLPLMNQSDLPSEGLRWDIRPSPLERTMKFLFGWRPRLSPTL